MMKSTAPPATNAAGPSTAVAGTWFELQPIELQPMELQPMELQPLPPEVPSGPTAATFMEAPEQIVVIHHPAPFTTTNPPGKSSAAGPSSLVSQQPAQPTTTANPPTPFTPVSNPSKIPSTYTSSRPSAFKNFQQATQPIITPAVSNWITSASPAHLRAPTNPWPSGSLNQTCGPSRPRPGTQSSGSQPVLRFQTPAAVPARRRRRRQRRHDECECCGCIYRCSVL